MPMIEVTTMPEAESALEASLTRPVFIFKHSTRCPVSAGAHRRVLHYLEAAGNTAPPAYLVNVIESRPVSNELAARLNIQHQSPQLILIRDKTAVWHASHNAIEAQGIQAALANIPS